MPHTRGGISHVIADSGEVSDMKYEVVVTYKKRYKEEEGGGKGLTQDIYV